MPADPKLVPITGSEPPALSGAKGLGPASPNEQITVTVKVRSKDDSAAVQGLHEMASKSLRERQVVSRENFARLARRGPRGHEEDRGLRAVAEAQRLAVLPGQEAGRAPRGGLGLRGGLRRDPAPLCPRRGDVSLLRLGHPRAGRDRAEDRGGDGPEQSPGGQAALPVPSQDDRRRPRLRGARAPGRSAPWKSPTSTTSPAGLDGSKQCIAIIELGGGYIPGDLDTYFGDLGISPSPEVVEVSVLGAKNTPGSDADGEVMLDIEGSPARSPPGPGWRSISRPTPIRGSSRRSATRPTTR